MFGLIMFFILLIIYVLNFVYLFFSEEGQDLLSRVPLALGVISVIGALSALCIVIEILLFFILYPLFFWINTSKNTYEILEFILLGGCLIFLVYAFGRIIGICKQKWTMIKNNKKLSII